MQYTFLPGRWQCCSSGYSPDLLLTSEKICVLGGLATPVVRRCVYLLHSGRKFTQGLFLAPLIYMQCESTNRDLHSSGFPTSNVGIFCLRSSRFQATILSPLLPQEKSVLSPQYGRTTINHPGLFGSRDWLVYLRCRGTSLPARGKRVRMLKIRGRERGEKVQACLIMLL